jgi:hypothetical protein
MLVQKLNHRLAQISIDASQSGYRHFFEAIGKAEGAAPKSFALDRPEKWRRISRASCRHTFTSKHVIHDWSRLHNYFTTACSFELICDRGQASLHTTRCIPRWPRGELVEHIAAGPNAPGKLVTVVACRGIGALSLRALG